MALPALNSLTFSSERLSTRETGGMNVYSVRDVGSLVCQKVFVIRLFRQIVIKGRLSVLSRRKMNPDAVVAVADDSAENE